MKKDSNNKKSYHYLFKICIVGDSGVGKTKLLWSEDKLNRDFGQSRTGDSGFNSAANLVSDKLLSPKNDRKKHHQSNRQEAIESVYDTAPSGFPSIGFKTRDYLYDDCIYRMQYWDCPGSERYMNLTGKYCSGSSGIILVFDLTSSKSFEVVQDWCKKLEKTNESIPKILVGNKDNCLSAPRQVPKSLAGNYASRMGISYYETDAISLIRTDAVFKDLFLQIADSIPPGSNPQDLMNKGIKLGPLLLSSKKYKQTLLTATSDTNETSFSMNWL